MNKKNELKDRPYSLKKAGSYNIRQIIFFLQIILFIKKIKIYNYPNNNQLFTKKSRI